MLFPGAAMFEAGRAAGAALADALHDLAFTSIVIPAPLLLPKSLVRRIDPQGQSCERVEQ